MTNLTHSLGGISNDSTFNLRIAQVSSSYSLTYAGRLISFARLAVHCSACLRDVVT